MEEKEITLRDILAHLDGEGVTVHDWDQVEAVLMDAGFSLDFRVES